MSCTAAVAATAAAFLDLSARDSHSGDEEEEFDPDDLGQS